jgi:ubiquinone/menaquinone biosynthesis C-methylase UbiE
MGVAVDLAAGTGLFTRVLAARVPSVYAVEPDDRMRAVLESQSPEVTALKGTGEAIPLPDASADGLFVSSAWHWLDHDRALPEIARVLRDGGRLGVLWTSRDRDVEWVRDLDRDPSDTSWNASAERTHRAERASGLAAITGFQDAEVASFSHATRMKMEDVVEMVSTYSVVITGPDEARTSLLDAVRGRLADRFPGAVEIELPIRSWCWRANRTPR